MRRADKTVNKHRHVVLDWISMAVNFCIILTGFFFLTAGTYASVQGIIDSFEAVGACKAGTMSEEDLKRIE